MSRALGALAAAVVLLVSGAPPATAAPPARLLAGAMSVTVSLPDDTPLGGYGGFPRRAWLPDLIGRYPDTFWFRPSTGEHDPIKVRALVLEAGSVRVLWLTLDVVGMDPTLLADLRARLDRLGLRYAAVIAAASHTHSGPGAYARSDLFGLLALDRESPRVRGRIFAAMEDAARQAERRKRPATVGTGRAEVAGITDSRVHGPLDPELGVLKVTGADSRPIAVVWNYAIHGTMLGRENFKLSGDVMGDAAARIEEQLGAPALYVNGAVGDVSPRQRGWDGVAATGKVLSAAVLALWPRIAADTDQRVITAAATAALPAPGLELRNCRPRTIRAHLRGGGRQRLPGILHRRPALPGAELHLVRQSLWGAGRGARPRRRAGRAPRGRRAARAAPGQAGALSLRASVDLRRAAVLRWMIPWVTARSIARMASCTAVADSALLPARASRAPLTLERTALRTARLRSRRFSFCLIRFLAERVLATVYLLSNVSDTRAYRPGLRVSRTMSPR